MSDWVCNPCHEIATGKVGSAVHYMTSYGRCEDCLKNMQCVDCRCEGDWPKARAMRRLK